MNNAKRAQDLVKKTAESLELARYAVLTNPTPHNVSQLIAMVRNHDAAIVMDESTRHRGYVVGNVLINVAARICPS